MENQKLKASEIKQNYSLAGLLASLGYEPVKRVRNQQIYLSMLRDSDSVPSFSVNDKQGTWYDFGEGKGGNIIDFGLRYWPVICKDAAAINTYITTQEIWQEKNKY